MLAKRALIIGGGIAGPVAALALRRAGIEGVVYESRTAPAESFGGALAIAPNGLAALGIVGADRVVEARGQAIRTMIIADGRGKQIGQVMGIDEDLYRILAQFAMFAHEHERRFMPMT